ncbi:MAG TPA: hypothetical protein VGK24_03925 [Candidatus Angelobacter sp.]|jgi:hypothetical protein
MFSLIANIASLAGVFLTIWALIEATGARRAAQEAREAVWLGNAVEEFKSLNKLASEFLGYVENNQIDAAALRARDLSAGILTAKQRWRRFLSDKRIARLEEASAQVSVISRTLVTQEGPSTLTGKQRILRFSHEVVQIIAEEAGTISSENDLRNNNAG